MRLPGSVTLCSYRGVNMLPVASQVPASGSYRSALARTFQLAFAPPAISILASGRTLLLARVLGVLKEAAETHSCADPVRADAAKGEGPGLVLTHASAYHYPDGIPDGDAEHFVFNLRYAGQYYDQEAGLNYNYFRDYEPGPGRYVESDPTGLNGGLSTYAYAVSNPLRLSDPFGLKPGEPFSHRR